MPLLSRLFAKTCLCDGRSTESERICRVASAGGTDCVAFLVLSQVMRYSAGLAQTGVHAVLNPARMFTALSFAAEKHKQQRRKDAEAPPYVNHVIAVATTLAVEGGVTDEHTLMCALLHDTVEDTATTLAELAECFGREIAALVGEVTDDKLLVKAERKRLQVEHARTASAQAKQVKIADKICNVRDVADCPPAHWTLERRIEYLRWSEQVVAGCRGINPRLDRAFDETVALARQRVGQQK